MHPLYCVFKVIYVDFKDVIVELLAFLDQVRLYSLILSDLVIHIGLDIHWQVLLEMVLLVCEIECTYLFTLL